MKKMKPFLYFLFVFGIFVNNSHSQVYDLILEDMLITTFTEPFVAENSITASDFSVIGNGNVTFKAGNVITLLPGFSVTDGGEFRAFISNAETYNEITISDNNTAELNNYPNPFYNKTTIAFTVPEDGMLKLTVLNSIGQTVKTLFEENSKEGAQYEIVFYAEGLKSGIYFYKLETMKSISIKKMILIKP